MDAPAAGFYHDDHQQASSTSTTATTTSTGGNNYPSKEDIKKRLTLDLNGPSAQRPGCLKKPRFDVLLSSPDLNMLKLPSPELEKLIMQQNGLLSATPTPSQFLYPNPRTVTHEQEIYARGFDDALAELHQNETAQQQQQQQQQPTCSSASNSSGNNNSGGGSTSSSGGGLVSAVEYCQPTYSSHSQAANYAAGNQSLQICVKEEPTCGTSVSSSPPLSPIDMENQERIKLERKRQRNRIAASKCRRRKLERIARLEDKVKILKGENSELATVVVKLRQQVCGLKEQVMEHVSFGCPIMLASQF